MEKSKKDLEKEVDELMEKGVVDLALKYSLSCGLLDKSLEIYEKIGNLPGKDNKIQARKKAGDLALKYGLLERARKNYASNLNTNYVDLVDDIYPVVSEENMRNYEVALENPIKYSLRQDFFSQN